jgi:hypothetical protein
MKKRYATPLILIVLGAISFVLSAIGSASSYVRSDGLLVEPFGLIVIGGIFGFIFVILGIIVGLSLSISSLFHNPKKSDKWIFSILIVGSIFLVCFGIYANSIVNRNIDNESKTAAALGNSTAASVKDATYLIDGQPITLVNGLSEISLTNSASKQVTSYFGNEATGDLNGDSKTDEAFLLTQDNGGSGIFYYATVALATDRGYQGMNAILLGDRIAPQTTKIENGKVVFNYVDRKPNESMAVNPSVGVSKYFQVIDNQLVEVK